MGKWLKLSLLTLLLTLALILFLISVNKVNTLLPGNPPPHGGAANLKPRPARAIEGVRPRLPGGSESIKPRGGVGGIGGWMAVETVRTEVTITYSPGEVIKGRDFLVRGSISAEDGAKLSGVKVSILLKRSKAEKGLVIGKGRSENGSFEVTCRVPGWVEVGDYVLVAVTGKFYEDGKLYLGASSDPVVKVKSLTSLEVSGPTEVVREEPAALKVRLLELPDLTPLEGRGLNVYLDGNFLTSLITDGEGSAKVTISGKVARSLGPGIHEVTVAFEGDEYHLGCKATFNLRVYVRTRIAVKPLNYGFLALKGRLIDSEGRGLGGLSVRASSGGLRLAEVTTGPKGFFPTNLPLSTSR